MSTREQEDAADRALANILMADKLAADTETTGKDYIRDGRHHMMGVSVAWGPNYDDTFYFPFRHKYGENLSWDYLKKLEFAMNHKTKRIAWHHFKFDAHSMITADIDMTKWDAEPRDSMISLHYLNENLPKALDYAGRVFLDQPKADGLKQLAKVIGWENLPVDVTEEYARIDALIPWRLEYEIYEQRLRRKKLYHLTQEELEYTKLLVSSEQIGVGVDLEFCAMMEERGEIRMSELRAELGFDPAKRTQLQKFLIDDMGLPVFKWNYKNGERTSPSFDKEALEYYDDLLQVVESPAAKLVLEYRGWAKAVTSLYRTMRTKVSPDGRIRTNLNNVGTVTGRLSSDSPNLQQIPRDSVKPWNGKAKHAFNAGDPDWLLVGFDYSQIELRLAAHYGRDQSLIDEFQKPNADPFKPIALSIFGDFNPELRQKAKTFTYAVNYGAGIEKVRTSLGVSQAQIEQIYENYHVNLPGIFAITERSQQRIAEVGYVRYWTGRRRHIKDTDKAYIAANSLLQGGAAEIVKRAQRKAPHDDYCQQVLQVHDEIVFRIRRDKLDEYRPQIIDAMTDFREEISIPLAVEGKPWGKDV